MKKNDYKEFNKRYDKFKNNNLPTPFYDEERLTLEYVWYNDELSFYQKKSKKIDELELKRNVDSSIEYALGDIANINLYYPFNTKLIHIVNENGKDFIKTTIGHSHAHSFSEVIRELYDAPESFSIEKEDYKYYSEQELKYLRKIQKYLLFIDLKDKIKRKDIKRYRNKKQKKYGNSFIRSFPNDSLDEFISGKRNYVVINSEYIDIYKDYEDLTNRKERNLFTDLDDNIKLFIEYTYLEKKLYKDIKNNIKFDNLKDNDQVVIKYFKVLEIFD